MIVFFLCCGDSTYSENVVDSLLPKNPILKVSVHRASFHKYQTTNNNTVYSIYSCLLCSKCKIDPLYPKSIQWALMTSAAN